MSRGLFIQAVEFLKVGMSKELEEAASIEMGKREKTPLAKTVRTCRNLLAVEKALWTLRLEKGSIHHHWFPHHRTTGNPILSLAMGHLQINYGDFL